MVLYFAGIYEWCAFVGKFIYYQNLLVLLVQIEQDPIEIITFMMECCFAAINTKGFETSLDSGVVPEPDHITYQGAFNELKFAIGPKAKKPMQLHLGFARSQYVQSSFDNTINNYLAIFTKGSKDGEDRDERNLNSVIVLDISGSMGGGLGGYHYNADGKNRLNRLDLAKQAIRMFFSKLRPKDSFGLVVFDDKADTIIECNLKSQINQKELFKVIDSIKTRGGTTLMSGFKAGQKTLKEFMAKKLVEGLSENRIVMLTDVCDNSMENAYQFVSDVQNAGISTTIIGISSDFQSSTCQRMNEVAGFNYMCATEVGDLKKHLFENFSYTFFPSNYNIQIGFESQQVQFFQVFGTVDAKKVPEYNAGAFGAKGSGKMVITRSKTSFPSELQISQNGQVLTYGSLIVVKLKIKEQTESFKGKINLSYQDYKKQKHNDQYPLNFGCPKNEQYFSDQSLQQGMSAFHYVHEVKQILQEANSKGKLSAEDNQKYCKGLKKLQPLAPKAKVQELNKLIKVLEGNKNYMLNEYIM